MAQAVFDEHPIEQYLRDSGDILELMPGGIAEFSRELQHDPYDTFILSPWNSWLLHQLGRATSHVLNAMGFRTHSSASVKFAEKFKYIVISSSLLSSNLATHRAPTPTTPGHYEHRLTPWQHAQSTVALPPANSSKLFAFSLATLIPGGLFRGYYLSCIVLSVASMVLFHYSVPFLPSLNREDASWSSTLENLGMLVSANDAWDGFVSEALTLLTTEDQRSLHPTSPSLLSSSLRVALSSSLHTIQTQCDNVRQLLSALTSPILLSQLSEMYAPPSPPPIHAYTPSPPKRTRPMSLVPLTLRSSSPYTHITRADTTHSRTRSSSALFTLSQDKNLTWNGSHTSLADGTGRQLKRPSDLSTVFRHGDLKLPTSQNAKGSSSVPPTPSQPLIDQSITSESIDGIEPAEEESFGTMALHLRTERCGVRSLQLEESSTPAGSSRTPMVSPLSSSFGSRFTTLNSAPSPSRHSPLSLPSIHIAIHEALAARRFACAHLLALRFHDPQRRDSADADCEDESYWEDVRSVIALLASTLEDASTRLGHALADAAQATEEEGSSLPDSPEPPPLRLPPPRVSSFAPVASHSTRFTAHIDAISAALDDARRYLQKSVVSLEESAPVALESYDRARRELGLALREYERGRYVLLERVDRESVYGGSEGQAVRYEDQNFSSSESDKTLFNVEDQPEVLPDRRGQRHDEADETAAAADDDEEADDNYGDDASGHLIVTATSQHLPPPGIEQVFEALSVDSQPYTRARSKISREERIRLANERRKNGNVSLLAITEGERQRRHPEAWGPGGEVVQELRDVILKVKEHRRKIVEDLASPGPGSNIIDTT